MSINNSVGSSVKLLINTHPIMLRLSIVVVSNDLWTHMYHGKKMLGALDWTFREKWVNVELFSVEISFY